MSYDDVLADLQPERAPRPRLSARVDDASLALLLVSLADGVYRREPQGHGSSAKTDVFSPIVANAERRFAGRGLIGRLLQNPDRQPAEPWDQLRELWRQPPEAMETALLPRLTALTSVAIAFEGCGDGCPAPIDGSTPVRMKGC